MPSEPFELRDSEKADAPSAAERDDDPPPEPSRPEPSAAEVTAVWRLLRRLGVHDSDADDATQEVFLVVAQRGADIRSGKRRSFVYGIALRIAREVTRRSRWQPVELNEAIISSSQADDLAIEDLIDRSRARAMLDELLAQMSYDLRVVFVLYEIEELETQEIADALDLPRGTVASRLRRAREDFQARVQRLRAQLSWRGER